MRPALCKPALAIGRLCGQTLAELFPSVCETELAQAHQDGWQIDSPGAFCHRCGASVGPGGSTPDGCSECVGLTIPWDGIVRLGTYNEPINRWVVSLKFKRAWWWASWFGRRLGDAIEAPDEIPRPVVCPVPMHWTRRLHRGYNQAHLIAAALAKHRRWPMAHMLRRTRHTRAQTAVTVSRRAGNIRGSFAIKRVDLAGSHICLVDDVKTTGATLTACARLLRRAGAQHVSVAVAAVADRQHTGLNTS